MDHIANSPPGITAIHNDLLCLWQEHDKYVLQLMKAASHKGIVFNSGKCSIWQPPSTEPSSQPKA